MGIAFATVGASLVLAIATSKVSDTVPPRPSSAVTLTEIVPTSPLAGVPLNVRVASLNVNHAGNAPPPANWAV